jgi:hypothetical protein
MLPRYSGICLITLTGMVYERPMRKLAREAVIFMLVGLVLAAIGTYAYLRHDRVQYIQTQRDALQRICAREPKVTLWWDQNGKPTSQAECNFVLRDVIRSV